MIFFLLCPRGGGAGRGISRWNSACILCGLKAPDVDGWSTGDNILARLSMDNVRAHVAREDPRSGGITVSPLHHRQGGQDGRN